MKSDFFSSKTLLPAKLPPYRKRPHFKSNVSDTLVVIGLYGATYVKNREGMWEISNMTSGSVDGVTLLSTLEVSEGDVTERDDHSTEPSNAGPSTTTTDPSAGPSNAGGGALSNAVVAVISVIVTLALGTLIVIGIFCGCSVARKRRGTKDSQYINLENSTGGGGGTSVNSEESNT